MSSSDREPFARDAFVDKPGIVGARWWHAALADRGAQIARRDAIRSVLVAGGVLAGFGAMLALCNKSLSSSSSDSSPETSEQRRASLEMQREYGWSFGAIGEALVFDGVTEQPFDRAALASLREDFVPARRELLPWYVQTLFESPSATPRSLAKLPPEEAAGFQPLASVMRPIHTAAMDAAYARGKALASVFAALADAGGSAGDAKASVVVDLAGPEAVAFAAGAADVFDPVFLFDNWPHPRGVVRAHETLAAASYYQPLFKKARTVLGKPPLFVLDRKRTEPYTDDATQFDNRYVAKLPVPTSALTALGSSHVLYVVPANGAMQESADLNDTFVAYAKEGVDVRPLPLDAFSDWIGSKRPPPPGGKPGNASDRLLEESGWKYYGGDPSAHHSFFLDYPWAKPRRAATARRTDPIARAYVPASREISRPKTFGTVPVMVAVGTGIILGARYSRSGSWNRASGGSGG